MMKNQSHETKHPVTSCAKCEFKARGFVCSTSKVISEKIGQFKIDSHYKAGETIFRAGDLPQGLFSVRSGAIKLEAVSADGSSHILRLVGAGGILGYRSFFSGDVYKKSAIALEDTKICFLPRREALELFSEHPELAFKLINQLGADLENAEEKWVNQIDKGAAARVADALLFLNEKFSGSHWTRKEIAEWAGTTTETVIRSLALFEKEGLISQKYRNFNILSESRLREKAAA